jgi:hypothetical protein
MGDINLPEGKDSSLPTFCLERKSGSSENSAFAPLNALDVVTGSDLREPGSEMGTAAQAADAEAPLFRAGSVHSRIA